MKLPPALQPVVQGDLQLLPWSVREVRKRFRALLDEGARLAPVGQAADDPEVLLEEPTLPRCALELFDYMVFLSGPLFDPHLGFMVAYMGRTVGRQKSVKVLVPRIVYKDISLVWRAATHVIHSTEEDWVGKGALRWHDDGDDLVASSAEETTDLPHEVQGALDAASWAKQPKRDDSAALLVLRNAPPGRLAPYADFTRMRQRDQALVQINRGRSIARFRLDGEPESLEFVQGFAPDLERGVLASTFALSNLYGGRVKKTRVLSRNKEIQYQFISSPTHVWINPPQSLTTSLTPYGTRTLDVLAPEDLFVPGYEYHFMDEGTDPPSLHSQIPAGFAGSPSKEDPMRADASAWIERLPPVVEYRRRGLAD